MYDHRKYYKNLPGARRDLENLYGLFKNFFGYEVHSTMDFQEQSTWKLTKERLNAFVRLHKERLRAKDKYRKLKVFKKREALVGLEEEDKAEMKQLEEEIEAYRKRVNLSKEELAELLKKEYDSLIFVYAGHGLGNRSGNEQLIGSDDNPKLTNAAQRMYLSKIQRTFTEQTIYFTNKPKIFFHLACRGVTSTPLVSKGESGGRGLGGEELVVPELNIDADVFTLFSNTAARKTEDNIINRKGSGSYLGEYLMEYLQKTVEGKSPLHLVELSMALRQKINNENERECPQEHNTLLRKAYFGYHPDKIMIYPAVALAHMRSIREIKNLHSQGLLEKLGNELTNEQSSYMYKCMFSSAPKDYKIRRRPYLIGRGSIVEANRLPEGILALIAAYTGILLVGDLLEHSKKSLSLKTKKPKKNKKELNNSKKAKIQEIKRPSVINAKPENKLQGWKCIKCKEKNKGTSKYCNECGNKKPMERGGGKWKCGVCNTVNKGKAKFCSECGTSKEGKKQGGNNFKEAKIEERKEMDESDYQGTTDPLPTNNTFSVTTQVP